MTRYASLCLAVSVLFCCVAPAHAWCGAPFLIYSFANDSYSYLVNPTVTPDVGLNRSSVSPGIDGIFWAVGFGDPATYVGHDNGTFAAAEWITTYPDYPAYILTSWATSAEIDGCPHVQGGLGERCTAMFLNDVDGSVPENGSRFALLAAADEPASGDFFFAQPDNTPIELAPLSRMIVLNGSATGHLLRGPTTEELLAGVYVDDAAPCRAPGADGQDPLNGLVVGFRPYRLELPRGAPPPTGFRPAGWEDLGLGVLPLGATFEFRRVNAECETNLDIYLAYTLVLDSGFESPYLSAPTTRLECGPNWAEPRRGRHETRHRRDGGPQRQR